HGTQRRKAGGSKWGEDAGTCPEGFSLERQDKSGQDGDPCAPEGGESRDGKPAVAAEERVGGQLREPPVLAWFDGGGDAAGIACRAPDERADASGQAGHAPQ